MVGSLFIRLLVNTAALLIAALVVKSIDDSAIVILNWQSALLAGAVIGLVNALIRPLVSCLTCLVQVITLGLFTFVLNALMLLLSAEVFRQVVPLFPDQQLGFAVNGFWPAFFTALLMSIASTLLTRLVK